MDNALLRISLNTSRRLEMIDITSDLSAAISGAGARSGLCHVFVPHTTAGVIINESADPAVADDILGRLEKLAPRGDSYRHSEGNADSHIKAAIVGSSVCVPVESGSLALGTWQGVFFCEFDGPRRREVWVRVVGEETAL